MTAVVRPVFDGPLEANLHAPLSGSLASLIDQSSRSLQMTGCMAPPWGRLSRPGGDALG